MTNTFNGKVSKRKSPRKCISKMLLEIKDTEYASAILRSTDNRMIADMIYPKQHFHTSSHIL